MAFLLEFKDRENAARRGNAKLSIDLQDRPPLTFPFLVNDLGPVDLNGVTAVGCIRPR